MGVKEDNIRRFELLLGSVNRPGIDRLLDYIRRSDFYTAPASTRFHLSCEGGLLQHSLNVYDCLTAKKSDPIWKDYLAKLGDESLIIIALLHDLCKIKTYVPDFKNQKNYDPEAVAQAESWQRRSDASGKFIWEAVPIYRIEDAMPLGHGEKSVMIARTYIELKAPELYAIRWHMGFSEDSSQYQSINGAMDKYPIVIAVIEADLEASKLLEGEKGNRMTVPVS